MKNDLVTEAVWNAPSQVRGRKAKLYKHPRRTHAGVRMLNGIDFDVCEMQEVGRPTAQAFQKHKRVTLDRATFNDRFRVRGGIGNATCWSQEVSVLDEGELRMRGRKTMHLPVHLFEKYRTFDERRKLYVVSTWASINVHCPTEKDATDRARKDFMNRINKYALNFYEKYEVPVLIGGDFNKTFYMLSNEFKTLVQADVQGIAGLGVVEHSSGVISQARWTVTDHSGIPWTRVLMPMVEETKAKRVELNSKDWKIG